MLTFPGDLVLIRREEPLDASSHTELFRKLVGRWVLYEPSLGALAYQSYVDYDDDPDDWELTLYLAEEHYRASMRLSATPTPRAPLEPPCMDALPGTEVRSWSGKDSLPTSDEEVARKVRTVCGELREEGFFYVGGGNAIVFGICDGSRDATVLVFRKARRLNIYAPE